MADDEKKRTQEASETNFTTRGGRPDETAGAGEMSGAGKPHTSPCKRGPGTMGAPAAPPADDAATVVGPPLPASSLPGDVIERILTALVQHAPFDTASEAGRALLGCGLVSKEWQEASAKDSVWRALFLRCSPAHVRARDGPLPAPETAPSREEVVPMDEEDRGEETAASLLRRSRYFADSIVSPFRLPVPPTGCSFRALFRSRCLAGRRAAAAYRISGKMPAENGGEYYEREKFTCATVVQEGKTPYAELSAGARAHPLSDISFIFELFKVDKSRRRRDKDREYWKEHPRPGEDLGEEQHDFVTDELRHAYAGPPHFAIRGPPPHLEAPTDLGDETENLLWAATVRASEDGIVQALLPLDDRGRVMRTHSVPIDTYMDDYTSEWCRPWRLVVTAVRDSDGKMCQIVDVRGSKLPDPLPEGRHRIHFPDESGAMDATGPNAPRDGFYEYGADTCTGSCFFRVAPLGGDSESLECRLHLGCSANSGPKWQGVAHRWDHDCNVLCAESCARARARGGGGPYGGRDNEPTSEDEGDDSETVGGESAETTARQAFQEFQRIAQAKGALFQVSLTWLEYRYRHNELDANVEHSYGSTTARRAQVWAADDSGDLVDMYDEAIDFQLTKVAGKLAQLNWT